jgi:hypothetical protein
MAEDSWLTYPIEFKGGLISNLSPLQQGTNAPGSARILRNFEPSIEGGYRRILGYTKYDSAIIPLYGLPVVHGGSQSGTTLIIASMYIIPTVGDTFTITGVSGTYTIASGGVSYDSSNKRATLTLVETLAASPANAAEITFTGTSTIYTPLGVNVCESYIIVAHNADIYKTSGSGYTKINVPSYGTVLVNGGSQTGTTLALDGLTSAPQANDTFKIAGINLIYTVTADATVASGGSTLAINPALASSPANNAVITFLSVSRASATNTRFDSYDFTGTKKYIIVDGYNPPATYDGTTFTVLDDAPADVLGSSLVRLHKNALFFAKGRLLTFTAPYTDTDFSPATGGGVIDVSDNITGLITFRQQLFIFTETKIFNLTGTSIADFQLQPVTTDMGCTETDSIQEIGTDVIFLSPDGLRLLGATDRVNDFNFSNISKVIQSEFSDFKTSSTRVSSVVIRGKSQYRLFGTSPSYTDENAKGIILTQLADEAGGGTALAETRGIRAHVADSKYINNVETIVFANTNGYLYQMESGNSFDSANIATTFSTPHLPISDPRLRKTMYKLFLYTDPQGSVSFTVTPKLDFDGLGIIQPAAITLSNTSTEVSYYGVSSYASGTYGGKLQYVFETQLIGSGYTISFQFNSESIDPPFSLDALTLEYANNSRR